MLLLSAAWPSIENFCPYVSGFSASAAVLGLVSTITGAVLSIVKIVLCTVSRPTPSFIVTSAWYAPSVIGLLFAGMLIFHFPLPRFFSSSISSPVNVSALPSPSVRFNTALRLDMLPSSEYFPLSAKSPLTTLSAIPVSMFRFGASVSTADPNPISQLPNMSIPANVNNNLSFFNPVLHLKTFSLKTFLNSFFEIISQLLFSAASFSFLNFPYNILFFYFTVVYILKKLTLLERFG